MHALTVIGCGTMGRAILSGLVHLDPPWRLRATVGSEESASRLAAEVGVEASTDNLAAVEGADVVVLAVKPQVAHEVLAAAGLAAALAGKVLVSIAAGITNAQLHAWAPEARVVRAMPNTPAVIGEGMTVLSPGPGATSDDLALVGAVFRACGRVRVLAEKHLDAVTGLSGSGPAFVSVILEALADGGVMMGLPRAVAVELAAQTMVGAARLVLETGEHPAVLRDRVTTPGGCTIAGLFILEEGRVRSTIARTVQEAARVACGLGDDR